MGLKVGITGGIGSGKSYVARIFKALGVPFYDADTEAKKLMNTDGQIRSALIKQFGEAVYLEDGQLNRAYLSSVVFTDEKRLQALNAIVHPVVIQHGTDWAEAQSYPYSLKEAALLFESGSYKSLDYTILVTAPLEMRIKRVVKRDAVSREQVLDRINKQMPDEKKSEIADFVIVNDENVPLLPQVLTLHQQFLRERIA
ncbi:dephospho-CoA kinase [Sphingobacterium allocomposti]|uniref:Dephospho-CoA kinase n=1 Tax=Sphingobacterium allocomposti TaxID=415956 RepID=A0A5S5DBR7_9SPHI|nr:dephospho-CoA kinase [Sphingobacterium composti Yoo et al. 2007 non Ten et al. 2007]TYP93145.1 dephospho-CoA kinase [Sphingobacterium composti Yoo et al. 2007 non Ten et al. 2007]HLS94450.1 dephospho-CoA kinase [Sphingobacterium sp.]